MYQIEEGITPYNWNHPSNPPCRVDYLLEMMYGEFLIIQDEPNGTMAPEISFNVKVFNVSFQNRAMPGKRHFTPLTLLWRSIKFLHKGTNTDLRPTTFSLAKLSSWKVVPHGQHKQETNSTKQGIKQGYEIKKRHAVERKER